MHRLIAVTCLLLGVLALSSCVPAPEPPLRVGSNQWLGYEPLYLARDLGFYDNQPVRLVDLTSATEVLRAFRQRQIDVAALTLDEALRLAEFDATLRVFLVTNISNGADKVLAREGISAPGQLRNGCIAHEESALGAYMLQEFLEHAGLDHDEVRTQPATIDQHLSIMEKGGCDAVISFDPMAMRLEQQGYHVIFDSSQIPGRIVDVLVTRADLMQTRSQALQTLVDGFFHALDHIGASPDDALQRIARRLGSDISELRRGYRGLILPDRAHNRRLLEENLDATLPDLATAMLKSGILHARPDTSRILDAGMVTE